MEFHEEEQCIVIQVELLQHIHDVMCKFQDFDCEIFLCALMSVFTDLFEELLDEGDSIKDIAKKLVPFLMCPIFNPEFIPEKNMEMFSEEVLNLLDQFSIRELHE